MREMMKPLVLCTCSREDRGENRGFRRFINENYLDALGRAGGMPVVYGGASPEESALWADGLFLSGGGDLDPGLFGESPYDPESLSVDPKRDREELALFAAFAAVGKPVFGVCRGIQVINVALGGTLWQHLPAQLGLDHSERPHPVELLEGGLLRALLGPRCTVNSFHHQAVKDPGRDLAATAIWDGVVEGIEHVGLPIFGVQWHPERMEEMAPLFEAFIALCQKGRGGA